MAQGGDDAAQIALAALSGALEDALAELREAGGLVDEDRVRSLIQENREAWQAEDEAKM